jgi:hypothetical protein
MALVNDANGKTTSDVPMTRRRSAWLSFIEELKNATGRFSPKKTMSGLAKP